MKNETRVSTTNQLSNLFNNHFARFFDKKIHFTIGITKEDKHFFDHYTCNESFQDFINDIKYLEKKLELSNKEIIDFDKTENGLFCKLEKLNIGCIINEIK